uniref:Uncharacterized protein n=1 Tax=Hyaloperonospora arabidopsidis (strain Emoy2) TaxID=559515 RepID=M4BFP2_HYAAE
MKRDAASRKKLALEGTSVLSIQGQVVGANVTHSPWCMCSSMRAALDFLQRDVRQESIIVIPYRGHVIVQKVL